MHILKLLYIVSSLFFFTFFHSLSIKHDHFYVYILITLYCQWLCITRIMLTNTIRKTLKQAKVGDTEDRISNLPYEILALILSFLPTKEAVKTTILSTRWKSIWSYVPTLNLNPWHFLLKNERFISKESGRKLKPRFLNYVDKALKGDGVHFLEKLSISGFYVVSFDGSDIESWITAAIKWKVHELVLSCECVQPPPEFHQSLFSCNSLVVLRLHLKVVLNFPRGSTRFYTRTTIQHKILFLVVPFSKIWL